MSGADPKRSRSSRLRKLSIGRWLVVAVGLVIAVVMLEGCLRFLRFSEPSLFYVYDHNRGFALRPLAEGWWHNEATNYVRINSAGFHDREHAVNKPPGTVRIAVLGESYAEAMQVPLTESFWAIAEQRLQQCPGMKNQKAEILNFGVSGYGTSQELITLRSRVWDYSPDIVLLAFAGSDVPSNFRPLINDPLRPYFVYRDGQLVLDRSSLDAREASRLYRLRASTMGRGLDWLTRHVRALQLLTSLRRAILTPAQTSTVYNELGLDGMVYLEPVDENWKEAWRVSEGLIAQMHKEVNERGARFYVVTLSSAGQVTPDARAYAHVLDAAGLDDLFYPDRRIGALGNREHIPVLNLAPLLREYAEKNNVNLHGFHERLGGGHWNEEGHRLAGELIANWLCRESPY